MLFLQEIKQAAEFLELPELTLLLSKPQSTISLNSDESGQHYSTVCSNIVDFIKYER